MTEKKLTVPDDRPQAERDALRDAEAKRLTAAERKEYEYDDDQYTREQIIGSARDLFGVESYIVEVALRRLVEQDMDEPQQFYKKAEVAKAVEALSKIEVEA